MRSPVPFAIVGAGAVAQALGRLLHLRGAPVIALASLSRQKAERAAAFIGSSVKVAGVSELPGLATHVLIAVSDQALGPVAETLAHAGFRTGVALHTCGARGPEALEALRAGGVACGMLHPLQTVPDPEQGVDRLHHITYGLAGDRAALDWAEEIVRRLDSRALHIAADRLSWYHAGAVLASNALVAVMDAATTLLVGAGVEPEAALQALEPLSRATLDNIVHNGPAAALTGPIVRGDVATVAAHLSALAHEAAIAGLYCAASRQLLRLARTRGLPEATVRQLESIIDDSKGGNQK